MLRLPCLATGTPQPATTKAVAVDTLSVARPSPPVPHTSMVPSGARTVVIAARIARTAPVISATEGGRIASAVRNAAIRGSLTSPRMIASKAPAASSAERSSPTATRLSASPKLDVLMPGAREIVGNLEKILQQGVTIFRGDAFRMELHAMDGVRLVHDAHDHAIIRSRGHIKARRQGLRFDRQ